jgi:hypothetical protein
MVTEIGWGDDFAVVVSGGRYRLVDTICNNCCISEAWIQLTRVAPTNSNSEEEEVVVVVVLL